MLPAYAELHCLSNFSFLRAASHPEELVARAHALGYAALAITDECSVAGVVRAHQAARDLGSAGLQLIIGAELLLADGPRLVVLAQNRVGYGQLCALISRGRRGAVKGSYCLRCADLAEGLADCLALLLPGEGEGGADLASARWLAARFPARAWLAVELLRGPDDRARLGAQLALAQAAGLPALAAGGVLMHVRARRRLHDTLSAIRCGVPLAQAGRRLAASGERHLRSRAVLADLYPPQLLAQTLEVARRCSFSLDELRYEYPDELVPRGITSAAHLRSLTEAGSLRRYPAGVPAAVGAQIEHELALIAELGYEPYFLTVHDIVAFARARGILCQGRGSAANSAVCYCLGITEVNPAQINVLFERFISRERNEPPDIDVDFEHERREEVIQYLYQKYGRERAALTATTICYRPKSALRDVGKALGFDLAAIDRLARNLAWWDRREAMPERFAEAGFDAAAPRVAKLLELAGELIGFPRHLSQHVGGFVISRGPLSQLVPVENASMPERSVIQWNKDDLDALGLLKIDVLALGMLSAIRRALDLVGAARGAPLPLQDIPREDPAVYDMLCAADSVGVFQVESRAQMSMLPRLKPRCFYDLVIEVAIVRPGPIQGGMVHPYLRRRQGLEAVSFPSQAVRGVLARTLGIPIFQEQVMSLAMVAAGFTPGEADHLRRSMAAWRRKGGLEHFERRLIEGMALRGYGSEFAQSVFQQILGFGEYGFPESHAASFALLVYVSAWLKRHHPAAFLCALINSQPMGFYAPSQLVQDAQRHGVAVRPVDATLSDWDCTLEGEAGALCARLGLRLVDGFSEDAARRLMAARRQAPFASVDDLSGRAALDQRERKLLAAAGALAPLAGHRRQAYWQAAARLPDGVLRGVPVAEAGLRLVAPDEGEDIVADYASLGCSLGRHPLALLRPQLARQRFLTAVQLNAGADRQLARAAGLVTCRQRPATASGVVFVTLEDETGVANIIIHGDLVARQRRELLGAQLLGVFGQLQREGQVVHLIAKRLVDHSPLLGALSIHSRDFH